MSFSELLFPLVNEILTFLVMLQSYQHFNNYNLSACFIFDTFIFILKKPRCGYHIRGNQKKVEYKYTKISYIGLFIYNKSTKMYLGDLMELS